MNKIAKFILSLDFELGWGTIESGLWKTREKKGVYKRLRSVLPVFLSALDALEFPVTWAFVGAMIEEPNKRKLDHLPLDIKNLTTSFSQSAESSTTDARDLFDRIIGVKTKHFLSSHTYSHVRFDYAGLDTSIIDTEMLLFDNVCINYGVKTNSLVFPQNIEGFHTQLRQLGYQSVRTAPERNKPMSKIVHLISSTTAPPPLSKMNKMDNGLVRHSGSMFYNTGARRIYRLPFVYKQALSGIKHAIKNDGVIHMWIHPFNLSESPMLLPSLINVMKYVSEKREKGLIQVATFT